MATRFYLPSSGTASVSPTFSTAWEDTTIAVRLPCFTYKKSTAMTTVSFSDTNALDKDILYRQYVSCPLIAQTIGAQTIKFQIRASETDAGNNLFTTLTIKVVSNDGTTLVGTILAITRDATEAALTTLTNRAFSATSTALAISEGDRLVFEIGLSGDPANGKSHSGSLRIGDVTSVDLAENDTATTDDNPWIEFVTGVSLRNVDYKLSSISDNNSNTTVLFRIYKDDGLTAPTRSSVINTQTKILTGSNTLAQIRTDINNNELWKWGNSHSTQQ